MYKGFEKSNQFKLGEGISWNLESWSGTQGSIDFRPRAVAKPYQKESTSGFKRAQTQSLLAFICFQIALV